ncbi:hypothetical protein NDU88_006736 [Pleurodeles waltl]|uniref:Uncharacterized protein n=1 Tax=Pleurodeles waltl TaxID=8319 RepID=A0AAV7VPY6_PLEWA|nr:hypothetical protein NDU88_006736 [Pleurodeles waltl]
MITPKAPENENLKEAGQEAVIPSGKKGALDSDTASGTTTNSVLENSGLGISDPVLPNVSACTVAFPSTPSSSPSNHSQIHKIPRTFSMEQWMGQILEELRAIKLSQEVAHKETKDQLSQLNTHFTHLSTRLTQVDQRISDLEDVANQTETTIPQIQSELEELQIKFDEMENRSRHSNLRFVGVPEDIVTASSITKAIKMRNFKSEDTFSFRVFSDMLVTAAHWRREFVGLIDDFKRLGAPDGIVQLAKLKVLFKGLTHVFQCVQDAGDFLASLK